MTAEFLDKILTHDDSDINEAVRFIYALQHGKLSPLKSGIDHLDTICLGGLFPGMIICIVSRSGMGKTFTVNQLRSNILSDKDRNVGMLLWNLEMEMKALLIQEFSKKIKNKTKAEILNTPPTQEELQIQKEVTDGFRDPRLLRINTTMTPEDFYKVNREYILRNQDKYDQLFILVDHIGILKGSDKTESIHQTMEYVNQLKLEFSRKVTFIILGQLNRNIEARWKGKESNPMNVFPSSGDVYGSDAMYHYADVILSQVIPSSVHMETYGVVNIERLPHMKEHVYDEDLNSPKELVRLKGHNRIYYHYLKVRQEDGNPKIYGQVLSKRVEEQENSLYKVYKQNEQPPEKPTNSKLEDYDDDEFDF